MMTEVSFVFRNGLILTRARLGGQPATLALDTGAPDFLVSGHLARRLRLKGMEVGITGVGPQADRAYRTLLPDVDWAGNRWTLFGAVIHGDAALYGEPPYFDGILGYSVLSRSVVRIDYPRRRIQLFAPGDYEVPEGATLLPMETRQSLPVIDARFDDLAGKVVLDSGSYESVGVLSTAVQRHRLNDRYPKGWTTKLEGGIGGSSKGRVVRLSTLTLGRLTLTRPVAHLETSASAGKDQLDVVASLGNGVLSRFHVTVDYPGQRLVLEPNDFFRQPALISRAGFDGAFEKDGYLVLGVMPGGAADRVLNVGDLLLHINDAPVPQLDITDLLRVFSGRFGPRVRLEVRDPDGAVRTVTLTLGELL